MYRDTVAARDIGVKAAVARLAKLAAVSEMQLEALQLQAEGSRIGRLGCLEAKSWVGQLHSW